MYQWKDTMRSRDAAGGRTPPEPSGPGFEASLRFVARRRNIFPLILFLLAPCAARLKARRNRV